jgi:hypothetical protein
LNGEHQVRRLRLWPDREFPARPRVDDAVVGPDFTHVPVHPEHPVGLFAGAGDEAVGVHVDRWIRPASGDLDSQPPGIVVGGEAFGAGLPGELFGLFPPAPYSSAPF